MPTKSAETYDGLHIVKIAYIVNSHPMPSTTFVRREISALEQQGVQVLRIALRTWDGELVDEDDKAERAKTRYVVHDGFAVLVFAVVRMLAVRPIRFMRALALACRMGWRAERALPVHIIYLAEACRIEPWLREAGVDHLHAHFGTNAAEVAMLVHNLGGPTWSFTVHGTETFDNPLLVNLAQKVRSCTFVVAVSFYGRAQIYRSVSPQDWHKVHIVHCGVDTSFRDTPTAEPALPRRILCVARLSPEKGHVFLLEAAQRLRAQGIEFELILAGDGELRHQIEAKIAQYGLGNQVQIRGWVNGNQVRDEILAARALIVPSLSEGLPVVIMEAMVLRRPVIATFVGGIPELVRPGENGWLVPASDADAMADAMRECLELPSDEIMRMGKAARERILLHYDVSKEVKQLRKLFDLRRGGELSCER